jgi:hypothetical protein
MIPEERPSAECGECGYPMARVRTDPSKIAALFRFECSACPATGTVEVRTEESKAAKSPLEEYHGDATPPVKE